MNPATTNPVSSHPYTGEEVKKLVNQQGTREKISSIASFAFGFLKGFLPTGGVVGGAALLTFVAIKLIGLTTLGSVALTGGLALVSLTIIAIAVYYIARALYYAYIKHVVNKHDELYSIVSQYLGLKQSSCWTKNDVIRCFIRRNPTLEIVTCDSSILNAIDKLTHLKNLSLVHPDIQYGNGKKEEECLDCPDLSALTKLKRLTLAFKLDTVPNHIGNFKHLEFLDLSRNHFMELPNSIISKYPLLRVDGLTLTK